MICVHVESLLRDAPATEENRSLDLVALAGLDLEACLLQVSGNYLEDLVALQVGLRLTLLGVGHETRLVGDKSIHDSLERRSDGL